MRIALAVAALVVVATGAFALTRTSESPPVAVPTEPPAPDVAVAHPATLPDSPTFRLAGVVRSESDVPIAGALACDHPAFGAAVVCATTAADGSFSFRVLAGFHKLEVVAPAGSRYLSTWLDDRDKPRDTPALDLRKGDRTDVLVRLASGHAVSGKVVDLDGHPVRDAQACADPADSPADWICVRTDADGNYRAVVPTGLYQLFFVPPDGSRLIPRWWRYGLDEASADQRWVGDDLSGMDETLPPGNLVYGKVVSTSGKPVEHALVCVDTRFPTGRICRPTNKLGEYTVAVRRGTFVIQFLVSPGDQVVNAWYGGGSDPSSARDVFVGGDTLVIGTLQSGKMLWGSVHGPDGVPLQGAYVNVYDLSGRFVTGGGTGIGGDYALVVPVGSYRVEVVPPYASRYVSVRYGGGDGKVIEIRQKDTDAVADVVLPAVDLP